MSNKDENISINYVNAPNISVETFSYSDGSSAAFAVQNEGSRTQTGPTTSATSVSAEGAVHDIMDLLLSREKATSSATTFAQEENGYNKNAVDSYIHHLHTLLFRYGSLLKDKNPEKSLSSEEINQGMSVYRSTRVDALLDELKYEKMMTSYFRELLDEARKENQELKTRKEE